MKYNKNWDSIWVSFWNILRCHDQMNGLAGYEQPLGQRDTFFCVAKAVA